MKAGALTRCSWWLVGLAIFAAFTWEGGRAWRTHRRLRELEVESGGWSARFQQLTAERDAALAALTAAARVRMPETADLALAERQAQQYAGWVEDLQEVIARVPSVAIPEMRYLTDEDWITIVLDLPALKTHADFRRALAAVRRVAKRHVASSLSSALQNYPGSPADIPKRVHAMNELAPYCEPPLPAEILRRYEIVRPGVVRVGDRDAIFRERDEMAIDREYDRLAVIGPGFSDAFIPPSSYSQSGK